MTRMFGVSPKTAGAGCCFGSACATWIGADDPIADTAASVVPASRTLRLSMTLVLDRRLNVIGLLVAHDFFPF